VEELWIGRPPDCALLHPGYAVKMEKVPAIADEDAFLALVSRAIDAHEKA
jgi:hypothetical protein